MLAKRVTIKDIAFEAKLTPAAVSRALCDKDDISLATKKKVKRIAREMGYITNSLASSLRSGKSKIIAIVHDNLINPYFSIMTSYIWESLKGYGYTFLTFVEPDSMLNKKSYLEIVGRNVDGIVSFLEPTNELNELIMQYKVPVMLMGRKTDLACVDYIITDDLKGGALSVKRLLQENCKKILYITEAVSLSCAYERFCGFKQAAQEAKVFDPKLVVEISGNNLIELFNQAMANYPDIDGVVCFNDLIAFEVLNELRKTKKPDIKVIGYDNIQESLKIPYQLTTIGSDKKQMAEVAVEVLLYKINNQTKCRKFEKVHDVFLVDGDSG